MLSDEDFNKLARIVQDFRGLTEPLEHFARATASVLDPIIDKLGSAFAAPLVPPPKVPPPKPADARRSAAPVPTRVVVSEQPTTGDDDGRLNRRAERMVLAVLAQFPEGRTKKQTAIQAGYALKGGGFNAALSRLRKLGLVEGTDPLRITQAGLDAAGGEPEPLPTGQGLLDFWLSSFNRRAEREVMKAVYDAYPEGLTKDEIAQRAGYEVAGGGFNGAISKNRTLGLVVKEGDGFRASEEFFDDGR